MATWGGFILDSLADYSRVFYLKELELITALLQTATLPTKTGLTFNAAGLNTALAELRTQSNESGQLANWKTETIVVPAALEGAALTLRQSMGTAFNIVTLPGASVATTWWMLTSANNSPVLRLTLSNGGQPSVYLNRRRGVEQGAEFALSHDCGFSIAGHTGGALKCTS
jgi:hypothetical protein